MRKKRNLNSIKKGSMAIYNKNHPDSIKKMFGSIAKRYDKVNAILSLNMHKRWNKKLVDFLPPPTVEHTLLDLCCGTGDVAFSYLAMASIRQRVIMVDFCREMLDCAVEKAESLKLNHHQIEVIQADVQSLPLKDHEVSCAAIAYGIRNVQDPLKCFKEVFRVLKPGGTLGLLELVSPTHKIIRLGHKLYLKTILPLVGRWVAANQDAYEYLCESIPKFTSSHNLHELLITAGFSSVKEIKLAFGAAALLVAVKPKRAIQGNGYDFR